MYHSSTLRYTMPRIACKNPPIHQCTSCSPPKLFKYLSKLKRHLSDIHNIGCIYHKCTYINCNFITKQQSILNRHQKETHGEKRYCCPVCYKGQGGVDDEKDRGFVIITDKLGSKGVYKQRKVLLEVRQSDKQSDELATTSLVTKIARACTFVQYTPPP